MKNKLLLFSMILLAAGVFLLPGRAMAENVSDATKTVTINVPQAVAWVLGNPGAINPTSAHFNFTGRAVADIDGTNTSDFGNPATPVSFLITNDTATSAGEDYEISFTESGGGTIDLTNPGGAALLTVTNAAATASVTLNLRRYGSTTDTELPQFGATTPRDCTVTVATDKLTWSAANILFNGAKQAPMSLLFDLNESSLTEADAPTALNVQVTFTALAINE